MADGTENMNKQKTASGNVLKQNQNGGRQITNKMVDPIKENSC